MAMRPIENHELQEPCRSVGTENEVPGGIVTDLFDDDGVAQGVQDVLRLDIVARRGSENLHERTVLRNWPFDAADSDQLLRSSPNRHGPESRR